MVSGNMAFTSSSKSILKSWSIEYQNIKVVSHVEDSSGCQSITGVLRTHSDGGEVQLTQLNSLNGAETGVIVPISEFDLRYYNRLLIKDLHVGIFDEETQWCDGAEDQEDPNNFVPETLSIHPVSDPMNCRFLLKIIVNKFKLILILMSPEGIFWNSPNSFYATVQWL